MLQYTDEMLEWTRQKTDYEHNKEIQRMLQAEIEQLNSCSMEIKSSVTKKPDLAHEQTHVG
jgi:hypothetical protein